MTTLNHAPALVDIEPVATILVEAPRLHPMVYVAPVTPDKPLILERVGQIAESIGSVSLAAFKVAFLGRTE